MFEFKLPQMTCGHCVKAVTAAVRAVDPEAKVEIDLPQQTLRVETGRGRDALAAALSDAGYVPAAA